MGRRLSTGSSASSGSGCRAIQNYSRGFSWGLDADGPKPGFCSNEELSHWEEKLLKPLSNTSLFATACEVLKPGFGITLIFQGMTHPLRVCGYLHSSSARGWIQEGAKCNAFEVVTAARCNKAC